MTAPHAGQLQLAHIPVSHLRPNPANPRSSLGELDDLVASVRVVGILQPLTVEPSPTNPVDSTFVVVMGHRRLEAARRAKLERVPCMIRGGTDRRRVLADMVIENVHRAGLHPLDEAAAFATLLEAGMTRAQIAGATGLSAGTVNLRLALLDLPDDAKRRLRAGHLNLHQAGDLVRQMSANGSGTVTLDASCPRHFDRRHPLAGQARARCDMSGHPLRGRIQNVACGACWEATIRADCAQVPA